MYRITIEGINRKVKNNLGMAVQKSSTSFSSRYSLQFFFFEICLKIQNSTVVKSKVIISIM